MGELGDQGGPFVGRGRHLSALDGQLAHVVAGASRIVLVDGPAGIGKTALIRHFVAAHPDAEVLRACGEENETGLPLGLLDQLLSPAEHDEQALPRPPAADAPTAGARLLDVLGELQTRTAGPLILVVDDAHWADSSSLQALAFALRRLRADRVLTVVVVREADDPALPEGLRRLLTGEGTLRVSLSGLSAGEVGELAAARGGSLPPTAVVRLLDHTDGNPLHVKALLEQVPPARLMSTAFPLPAPLGYARLIEQRLADCTAEAQALTAAASVLGMSCPLHSAARLAELKDPLPALDEAVGAGLLDETPEPGGPRVSFPHPMLRATVYRTLGPVRRHALHQAAAGQSDSAYGRLQHLVHAAQGPDDTLAGQLADAARTEAAARRWGSAAPLLRDAARLARTERDRERYGVEAVEALLWEGRRDEAQAVFDELPGDGRSAAHRYARALILPFGGDLGHIEPLLREAWNCCDRTADPELASYIAGQLSVMALSLSHGRQAAEWAEQAMRLSGRRTSSTMLRFARMTGYGLSGDIGRGLAVAARLPDASLVTTADVDLLCGRGLLRMWSGELADAERDLREALFICRDGPMMLRIVAMFQLGLTQYALGAWEEAAQRLESAASLNDDTGNELHSAVHGAAGWVVAALGDYERAEWHLRQVPDIPVTLGTVMTESRRTRAFLALLRGQPDAAEAELLPLLEADAAEGLCEPMTGPWRDLLAEALIGLGRLDEADHALTAFEALAADRGHAAALAAGCRIRGELLAARHEPGAAEGMFATGLAHAARVTAPYERARLQLASGELLRRTGRRAAAAQALQAAYETLTGLGAVPLLERCARELAACGTARAAGGPPSPPDRGPVLTSQELAVARLAASGLTNRQVARELLLSVKTVEYHLGHAYTKLGISSRVGLATRLPPGPVGTG
uniref:AAA family ATPase n=1 Tax=Streptomyces sp. NBC_00093 TaxID=2975649 RepID=A0AAU2A614_9ACTN